MRARGSVPPNSIMQTDTELFEKLSEQVAEVKSLEGLHQADAALVFSALFRQSPGLFLWLCLDNRQAEKVAENLRFFLPKACQDRILVIPGAAADPYRGLSPHPEIAERRALGLWRLLRGYRGFVVTTVASMATRLPSPVDFSSHCLRLEVGNCMPLDQLLAKLRENGYMREDPVSEVGEYSWRGGIVDIYSASRNNPVRVEFFGDEIDSIREFDPATQRSIALIPVCEIIPMREMVMGEREIARWHQKAPNYWSDARFADALNEKLQFTENHELFNGFEYLFPLVIDNRYHLLDFWSEAENSSPKLIVPNQRDFVAEFEQLQSHIRPNFEEREATGELALPPERLFFQKSWLVKWLKKQKVFHIEELSQKSKSTRRFDFHLERRYQGRIRDVLADVANWQGEGERVVFVMASWGMAERIVDIFREYDVGVHLAREGFEEVFSRPLSVTQGSLSEGFLCSQLGPSCVDTGKYFRGKPAQIRP